MPTVGNKKRAAPVPFRPLNDLLNDPIIWVPAQAANPDEAQQFKPEVYYGVAGEYQFLVLRYEDANGVHYQGQAQRDDGSIVALPDERCQHVFDLARRSANLNDSFANN